MSTYYNKYLKYKKKYLEIQTKINQIKNKQSGGFLFFNKSEPKPKLGQELKSDKETKTKLGQETKQNLGQETKTKLNQEKKIKTKSDLVKSNLNENIINFISPHHRYLIENPSIHADPEKREHYLLKSYINNQLNSLI
jgi:hypothetical protein